ncbi:hypothetical protein GCM10028857_15490 [Salinarchaeum chitinilyticum]
MTLHHSRSDDGSVVEVEFTITEPVYPFVSIAQRENCEITLEKQLPRDDGRQVEYFSVAGADPHRVVDTLADRDDLSARVLVDEDGLGLVEITVDEGCPAQYLANHRAIPTTVEGTPAGGKIVAEVMPADDPGALVDAFETEHAVELVAKRTRTKPTPLLCESELQTAILDDLTDRQREVLQTAHEAGYYQRPRGKTGEEIAADLGISPTTFQEHVRAAERKIVTFLVDDRT